MPTCGLPWRTARVHGLGLRQQFAVRLDVCGAGLVDCLGKAPGVGRRDPAVGHRIAQSLGLAQRLGCPDLAASLMSRQARVGGQHLDAAVTMALPARHRGRSRDLERSVHTGDDLRDVKSLEQLRARRRALVGAGQHLLHRGLGPSSSFDQHEHIIPWGYDIFGTFS